MTKLTGQTIPITTMISLLIKLSSQNSQILNSMHEGDGFSEKNSWKNPFSFFKLTGRAMVRSAISDKWKAPLDDQGVTLSKKNVRAACPKYKPEFKIFFSPAGDLKI